MPDATKISLQPAASNAERYENVKDFQTLNCIHVHVRVSFQVITTGGVTYKNDPWHRECFTCTHCQIPLAGQRFTSRDEQPYCADCFGELFAKRCTACTKPITGKILEKIIETFYSVFCVSRHWRHTLHLV